MRAVVHAIGHSIAIGIIGFASVSQAIVVGIFLPWIKNLGAVIPEVGYPVLVRIAVLITYITDAVAVGIRLIRVCFGGAIVLDISDAVAIRVRRVAGVAEAVRSKV